MKIKITLLLLSIVCCSVKNVSAFMVTLSASQTGTLCQYVSVDFSANVNDINNYSKTAVWKVDGVPVFTAGPQTSNAYFVYPNPGSFTHGFSTPGIHQVWCEVSSPSYNSGNPVFSDTLTYSITQNEPPSVTIVDMFNSNTICRGTLDVFTATPVDAGTPTYTWYVDGIPDLSSTTATFNYIPLTAGVHMVYCEVNSSQACDAISPQAISNTVFVYVDPCTIPMPASGTQTISTCGNMFTDSGDQIGNYGNNESGVLTVCPALPGLHISVQFISFNTEASLDVLSIYDGNSIAASILAPSPLSGSLSSLPPFTSTASSGCLTFRFLSNGSVINSGWTANISCSPWSGQQLYISGSVYFDANSSGTRDNNEPFLSNRQVTINPPPVTAFTWGGGSYTFLIDSNQSYQIGMNPPSGWQVSSSPTTYNISSGNTSLFGVDFGINFISPLPPDVSLLLYTMSPICNQNGILTLRYQNAGSIPASGIVNLVHHPSMAYVSASPPPDSINGNILMWNYTNLLLWQPQYIYVTFTFPGPQAFISNTATITALDTLAMVIDSSSGFASQVVLCSYDPNDKAVNPQNDNVQNYTLLNSPLDYTIRFQNTGNAPASDVELVDTLSTLLDVNSLQIISSSHQMITTVEGGNILHFRFLNINLPDSNANEPASHGYVTFRIKPNAALPDPSVINNTAYIFFDLNLPVQTNTTINTMTNSIISVQENSNIFGQSILLIPNPATNEIKVQSLKFKVQSVEVYNALGQQVYNSSFITHHSSHSIDVSRWNAGIYFVLLKSDNEIIAKKFVVSR